MDEANRSIAEDSTGLSPFDTPLSAALRFTIELVAWIAGPWAAVDITGSSWSLIPALIVLVGLPAVFNTPGDKKVGGVAVSGPVRLAIEAFLLVVAVMAAFFIWPAWAGVLVTAAGVAMIVASRRRYAWLVEQR